MLVECPTTKSTYFFVVQGFPTYKYLLTFALLSQIRQHVVMAVILTKPILSTIHISIYYINTNEIPGELSCKNMISSHVKITCYLHM